ncbi:MAG: PRC-barrel domain-containing protein [Thermoplasmata archaeon]|nr:PRC-barrel domain-containing protein [Thermoplasmata archaeon]
MLVETTDLMGLEVFTHKGIYLGRVHDIQLDVANYRIYDLMLGETNPTLVEESRTLGVPYRWVQSVSEVIVLRYFPGKIKIKPRERVRHRGRRKLRVVRKDFGDHGVSRKPWK